jgi:hypothetical protein
MPWGMVLSLVDFARVKQTKSGKIFSRTGQRTVSGIATEDFEVSNDEEMKIQANLSNKKGAEQYNS